MNWWLLIGRAAPLVGGAVLAGIIYQFGYNNASKDAAIERVRIEQIARDEAGEIERTLNDEFRTIDRAVPDGDDLIDSLRETGASDRSSTGKRHPGGS